MTPDLYITVATWQNGNFNTETVHEGWHQLNACTEVFSDAQASVEVFSSLITKDRNYGVSP